MENARHQIAAKACDACRRRKLRCSVSPASPTEVATKCIRCIQTDLACTYEDEQRKRGPKSGSRLHAIRVMQQQCNNYKSVPNLPPAGDETFQQNPSPNSKPTKSVFTLSSPVDTLDPSFNLDHDRSQAWEETYLLPAVVTGFEAESHTDSDILEFSDLSFNLNSNGNQAWGELQLSPHVTNIGARTPLGAEERSLGFPDTDFNGEDNCTQTWGENIILIADRTTVLQEHSEVQLPAHADRGLSLSKQSLTAEVLIFFEKVFAAYPVIYYESIMEKLNSEAYLSDSGLQALLLSIGLINEAFKLRYSSSYSDARLVFLARTIEDLRRNADGCNFSDNPSMDTVVVSLFLFIAYSVCGKHNRAFSYLTEAIGLLDLVEEPLDPIELIRLQRLEHVLFITESASVSIYGSQRKRRIARRPSNLTSAGSLMMWYRVKESCEEQSEDASQAKRVQLDKKAIKLLLLMTRLHMASEVTEVANVPVDDMMMEDISASFDHHTRGQNISCSIQTADVAITRQWKLACHWWTVLSTGNFLPSSTNNLTYTIQIIGMSVLQWSKTISPGQLRIVGLGKIAVLTDAILNIALRLGSLDSCRNILGDLLKTVAATDYEREFAPHLSSTELCLGYVSRPIMFNEDFERLLEADEC